MLPLSGSEFSVFQSGSAISNKFTALRGRKVHAPIIAGNRNTSPFATA
jgi:hypothetical protein